MEKTIDVLAIGNPCVDIVIHAARIPAWDDKCVGSPAGLFCGGTEANVACAASRLGLATAVLGQVGDDPYAELLLNDLVRFGVDCSLIAPQPDAASSSAIVLVSPQGERAVVWVPMLGYAQPPERLHAALARSRMAYTMPYDEADLRVLSVAAHSCGAQLAIDVEREGAAVPGSVQRMLQHCDIAFLNASGFTAATGDAPGLPALQALHAGARAHTIVVSLGAEGAMAVNRQGAAVQPAFAAPVADTTGAGDTFNAAFLAAQFRGLDLRHALRFACAAASHTVAVMGARSSLPTADQVSARLGQTPIAA